MTTQCRRRRWHSTSPSPTPRRGSYLIVYPSDAGQPVASDPNWPPGKTVPNMVVVKLAADGTIKIYNGFGSTHIVVDMLSWYS